MPCLLHCNNSVPRSRPVALGMAYVYIYIHICAFGEQSCWLRVSDEARIVVHDGGSFRAEARSGRRVGQVRVSQAARIVGRLRVQAARARAHEGSLRCLRDTPWCPRRGSHKNPLDLIVLVLTGRTIAPSTWWSSHTLCSPRQARAEEHCGCPFRDFNGTHHRFDMVIFAHAMNQASRS